MYSNIEHVLIRSHRKSPLDWLDRIFYLYERPAFNLCNHVWISAIDQAAHDRKLDVLLDGRMGNLTATYDGFELLTELFVAGRFIRLWREVTRWVEKTNSTWRGALIKTLGPVMPAWLWRRIERRIHGRVWDVFDCTAIRADCFAKHDLAALARERDFDFSYRPMKDGFTRRLWGMTRIDHGDLHKGTLATSGVDRRAPLSDMRLVEFCLSIPNDQYLANGVPRALAKQALSDRLPSAVLNARKNGYQAADWHEGLSASRAEIAAELSRLSACAPATNILDIDRLSRLIENWPTSGWERNDVIDHYRGALLHAISAGHFLRKASGAN